MEGVTTMYNSLTLSDSMKTQYPYLNNNLKDIPMDVAYPINNRGYVYYKIKRLLPHKDNLMKAILATTNTFNQVIHKHIRIFLGDQDMEKTTAIGDYADLPDLTSIFNSNVVVENAGLKHITVDIARESYTDKRTLITEKTHLHLNLQLDNAIKSVLITSGLLEKKHTHVRVIYLTALPPKLFTPEEAGYDECGSKPMASYAKHLTCRTKPMASYTKHTQCLPDICETSPAEVSVKLTSPMDISPSEALGQNLPGCEVLGKCVTDIGPIAMDLFSFPPPTDVNKRIPVCRCETLDRCVADTEPIYKTSSPPPPVDLPPTEREEDKSILPPMDINCPGKILRPAKLLIPEKDPEYGYQNYFFKPQSISRTICKKSQTPIL